MVVQVEAQESWVPEGVGGERERVAWKMLLDSGYWGRGDRLDGFRRIGDILQLIGCPVRW